jgi:membrane-associated phospholipid phosphatase
MGAQWLEDLSRIDRAIYQAVEEQQTPALDRPLRSLSNAANRSVLWLVVAAVLALVGGPSGRRAAIRGLMSIGLVSFLVNLPMKALHRRARPVRGEDAALLHRQIAMPTSSSFPSGHSASAFAFATAVGVELPIVAFPLRALAAAVAYSRVHTGVHYPGDALAGSLIGAVTGQIVSRGLDRAECLGSRSEPTDGRRREPLRRKGAYVTNEPSR